MNNIRKKNLLSLFIFLIFFHSLISADIIKIGVERLKENPPDILKGKSVGIISNQTSLDHKLQASISIISSLPDIKIVALYSPEHGFMGGESGYIEDLKDETRSIPIYSLHGKTKKPTRKMLKGVEVLIFDIQDIGVRSYTFISTMKNSMESAAENGIPFIVLDRPNPLGGVLVDGPVLDMKFTSFIGVAPTAYVHGMTIGELALFFNKELNINCNLAVIQMEGWERRMKWQDTGLIWTPTSPHIPEPDTPIFYATTGILGELPLVNIGVGYTLPFKIVGAPWMDAEQITEELNKKKLPGVYFQPFYFTPFYHHYKNELCKGFKIIVTDVNIFLPVSTGYHIIDTLIKTYPENFNISKLPKEALKMFNQANGTDKIYKMFKDKTKIEELIESYQSDFITFKEKREKYLIYK